MTDGSSLTALMYYYAVVRVVPDPIKDEAINIGVVVVDSKRHEGTMQVNQKVRTRIKHLQSNYPFDDLERSIADLRDALGLDVQLGYGESERPTPTFELLRDIAERLNNQLQLTMPQRYIASSLDDAARRLFKRYVARRLPSPEKEESLTHASLKEKMLRIVRSWKTPTLDISTKGFLQVLSALLN